MLAINNERRVPDVYFFDDSLNTSKGEVCPLGGLTSGAAILPPHPMLEGFFMSSTKDIVLLAIDDATVTLGSQFREVALGLLITALNPAASSYAWYFLAASVPGLIWARAYGWASERFDARRAMMVSYAVRLVLVLGLWRITAFWAAMAILAGMTTASGCYSAFQAHYVAVSGDFAGTRNVILRLRQSTGVMLLVGPLLAGLLLSKTGYRSGFLVSAVAYGIALWAVSRLSLPARRERSIRADRPDWRPDGPSLAMLGLSFLTWQANTLAMAYTFHVLHRQSFGYGLTLSVWGGSGLLVSLWLARIRTRPLRWISPMFFVLGLSWLILSRGVSFPWFIVLSGIEGVANWMVQDLASASMLSWAPVGQAGRARAKLGAFEEMGSIAGTLAIVVMPKGWLVLPMYAILGILGVMAAGAWLMLERWLAAKHGEGGGNAPLRDRD